MSNGVIRHMLEVSASIRDGRDCKDVLASSVAELGELGEEVRIKYGPSYKTPGPDGVLGEAVDVIINAMDMIYTDNPTITVEEIEAIIHEKTAKWKQCIAAHQAKSP